MKKSTGMPSRQGLYDPRHEHDACGIGFVVNIKGEKANQILRQALTVLVNLDHRGARGADPDTGDGAGILMQIPHRFFQHRCEGLGIDLPNAGQYGVGMIFSPDDREARRQCREILDRIVE